MSQKIKSKVKKFVCKHSLYKIDYETLKRIAVQNGYTTVEYNNIINNENVSAVITELNLGESILHSRGFTYVDKNYRLIFINEDLNDEEKTLVLAHELGHVECEHFGMYSIIGKDVRQEFEASEFAHYLINQSKSQKIANIISGHKLVVFVIVLLIFTTLLSLGIYQGIKKEQLYMENYYITSTGNKYHRKDCIFAKDRKTIKRLTKEEFESGSYEACDMCLPDK